MQSLLGLFYKKIHGSQEDIASEGLVYILNSSIEARNVIKEIINSDTDLQVSQLSYKAQSSGDNRERPDISGLDEKGREVVLIEAKFWASLTHNQPNGYLSRLGNDTVLIFLVPTLRERSVFEEVLDKVKKEYSDIEIDVKNRQIRIAPANQYILFKNWNEILNQIKSKMTYENDQFLISDVNQIIGFCDVIDNNSFKPIMEKDLSQDIPRKIHSYYDVVDKIVDEINNQLGEDIHMLNRTAQRYGGYHRYFAIGNIGFAACMKMDLWAKDANTPFWLLLQEVDGDKWTAPNEFVLKCEEVASQLNVNLVKEEDVIYISLQPLMNDMEDVVVEDMVRQIDSIYKGLTI